MPLVQVGGGVVVEDDREVDLVVDVVEHAGHGGGPTGEEEVLGVGPPGRAQADPAALDQVDGPRSARCRSTGRSGRRPPAPTRAPAPSGSAARRRRRAGIGLPGADRAAASGWRRAAGSSTSGGISSQRSMIAAARASVPRASALLLVGQGQDPQGQDLVDLGGVEEIPLALGRHRGMVVRMIGDDSITSSGPRGPISTGKVPTLRHGRDGAAGELGRVEQGHEPAAVHRQQRVDRDQRPAHGLVAAAAPAPVDPGPASRSGSRPSRASRTSRTARASAAAVHPDRPRSGQRSVTTRPTIAPPLTAATRLDLAARRQLDRARTAGGDRLVERRRRQVELGARPPPSQVVQSRPSDLERRRPGGTPPVPVDLLHRPRLHLQAADPHVQPGRPSPGSTTHSVCIDQTLARRRPRSTRRGASTPNCQRSWFLPADAR